MCVSLSPPIFPKGYIQFESLGQKNIEECVCYGRSEYCPLVDETNKRIQRTVTGICNKLIHLLSLSRCKQKSLLTVT